MGLVGLNSTLKISELVAKSKQWDMLHKIQISGSLNKLKTSKTKNKNKNNPSNWETRGLHSSVATLLELGPHRQLSGSPGPSAAVSQRLPRPAPLVGRQWWVLVGTEHPSSLSNLGSHGRWILMSKFTVPRWLSPALHLESDMFS